MIDKWMLPLIVLAFTGVAVTFLDGIITPLARWVAVVVAFLVALSRDELSPVVAHTVGKWVAVFAVWALCTHFWSEAPDLSLIKAIAFVLVVFGCLSAGRSWARLCSLRHSMHYLFPLTALVMVAGLLGKGVSSATISSGNTTMYQGLVNGPNMFGSMAAMCVPFLAWQLYCHRGRSTFKYWILATAIIVVLIVLSRSRAAFGVAALTLGGCLLSMPTDARRKTIGIGLVALLASGIFASNIGDRVSSFIYKFDSQEKGLLYTREGVWTQSYENAKAGGWAGAGYGVTIGSGKFKGGVTAIGYGREKGSTWLALAEETGIIGVILFGCLIIGLLNSLIRALVKCPNHDYRVLLGIVSGAVVGMVFLSFFEGWWVAPGSPESGCFWVLCGIGIGLVERSSCLQTPIGAPE